MVLFSHRNSNRNHGSVFPSKLKSKPWFCFPIESQIQTMVLFSNGNSNRNHGSVFTIEIQIQTMVLFSNGNSNPNRIERYFHSFWRIFPFWIFFGVFFHFFSHSFIMHMNLSQNKSFSFELLKASYFCWNIAIFEISATLSRCVNGNLDVVLLTWTFCTQRVTKQLYWQFNNRATYEAIGGKYSILAISACALYSPVLQPVWLLWCQMRWSLSPGVTFVHFPAPRRQLCALI